MDNVKAPASPQGEPGDIDIFLFSNGEALAPPRKYHLTAQELTYWDSTLNFLARAQYGLHASIDLYTIDGKKVETPLELANNSTYVAVETKDTFLPGGYDQYLMRASKSWIKRYGSVSSNTTSKEKVSAGTALQSDKTTNNTKLEKVTEVKETKAVEENTTEIIETALINIEVNGTNENHETTKLPTKNDLQKPEEKKKTTPRSPILRKNLLHTNGKNHLNAKDRPATHPPLKKRPGSPPVKNTTNKVTPLRRESLIKSLYSPRKPKNNSSQNANKTGAVSGSDIGPDFIIPAKLSSKPETEVQSEPIGNRIKKLERDVDQITRDELYYESVKQILSPLDDILKREISTREYPDIEDGKKVTDMLEPIRENLNVFYGFTQNKKPNDDCSLTKSFSTEIQHGDVIKLRLSIEVTQGDNKDSEDKSLPLMNNEIWRIVIKEKSIQVNMDEMIFQKETLKGILEELQKNKPDAAQNYVILHCDCCNNDFHETFKLNEGRINSPSNTVNRVRNNEDYAVLIPFIKPDDDVLGCKCDTVPKSDKIVQTSIIFETTEYSKVAPCKQTVDKATDAPRESLDVTSVSRPHPQTLLRDRACETSETLFENKVPPTLLPSKESRTVPEQCPACSNTPRHCDVPSHTKMCAPSPPPKECTIATTECLVCRNKPKGNAMLDKSTQTDFYCFMLEARRHLDGHYSFHLPPLHIVKLYNY